MFNIIDGRLINISRALSLTADLFIPNTLSSKFAIYKIVDVPPCQNLVSYNLSSHFPHPDHALLWMIHFTFAFTHLCRPFGSVSSRFSHKSVCSSSIISLVSSSRPPSLHLYSHIQLQVWGHLSLLAHILFLICHYKIRTQ